MKLAPNNQEVEMRQVARVGAEALRRARHACRVVELPCAGAPEHGDSREARLATELVYGKAGWLERLGFKAVEERSVAWTAVLALEEERIVIGDEAAVK